MQTLQVYVYHFRRRVYLAAYVRRSKQVAGFVPGARAVERFGDLPRALSETFRKATGASKEKLLATSTSQERQILRLAHQPADFHWNQDFYRGNSMQLTLWRSNGRWTISSTFPQPYRDVMSGRPVFQTSDRIPVEQLSLVLSELITEHTRKDRLIGDKADWREALVKVGRIYEVSPSWWDLVYEDWPVHKRVQRVLDAGLPAGVVAPVAESDRLWFIVPAGHSLDPEKAQRLADKLTSELDPLKPREIA